VGCSGVRRDLWAVNYTNVRFVHLGEPIYPPHDVRDEFSVTVFGQIPWDTGMQLVHNYNEWLHLNLQLLQMRQNRTIYYRVRSAKKTRRWCIMRPKQYVRGICAGVLLVWTSRLHRL
jgi:hypothetical protein